MPNVVVFMRDEPQQGDLCQPIPTSDVGSVFVVVTEKATGTDF